MNKLHVLMLLVILIASSVAEKPRVVEGRTLSLTSQSHQGYSKIFATLGVVCKCCDGVEGACTSTWTEPCPNLQCSPWKYHTE
uniref:Uncharacterized protein n=2 Tax=Cajanus cajan TaxID=3821 RepID=A0A151SMC6_CAJCA|nr:hypothetical protein KK1_002213 [Cajanus cajan]